jgi:hypothetical protein
VVVHGDPGDAPQMAATFGLRRAWITWALLA